MRQTVLLFALIGALFPPVALSQEFTATDPSGDAEPGMPRWTDITHFDTTLAGDTPDLRTTRTTLTAALLSAAAGVDLSGELRQSGLVVDDGLFRTAYARLTASHPARGTP